MMGSLARTDDYDLPDVGAPLIPSGPQVSPGMGAVNRVFDRLPSAVMGGLAQMVQTPGALMQPNPYPPGSEEADFYEATKKATAAEWGPGTALNMMGGGVAGTGKSPPGPGLAAGYSSFKLPKPIEEMSSLVMPKSPAAETVINPAKLQGSLLLPLVGDRTAAAAELARVNGYKFENPVALEGGHGYMANNPGMAWAAGKSIAPGIARVAQEGAATGKPVHGVYTAMSETAPDFSVMMSDTLTEMLKHTKPTREGARLFNETMKSIDPGFPSVRSAKLPEYLREAPGGVRSAFAKAMDTSEMAKHGFPSVAEARVAVTDPRLLNVPTGASGLSIARMDPKGGLGPSGHGTYDTGILGNYVGGFPVSIPKEIIYPDVVGALSKHADAVAQARLDAGLKPFRPTEDYLMTRTPKGLPRMQEANQKWVDTNSQYLLDKGFTLGSGATDKKMGALLAATDNQPTGIKAYHSSPHDFDKFDLAKIGTGEGAQVYGHGLYFAENPAVSGQGGQYWNQFSKRFHGPEGTAATYLNASKFDREKAAQMMRDSIGRLEQDMTKLSGEDLSNYRALHGDRLKTLQLLESGKPVGPRTYEVNINADPAHMLDWDKSMSAQPEVMNRIRPLFSDYRLAPSNYLGESVHKEIRDFHMGHGMSKPAAAEAAAIDLRSSGIPGIKYLDEGSRTMDRRRAHLLKDMEWAQHRLSETKPEAIANLQKQIDALVPTSNYVIFDPANIAIMKKYGIAGAAAPMGAIAAQDAYQPRGD